MYIRIQQILSVDNFSGQNSRIWLTSVLLICLNHIMRGTYDDVDCKTSTHTQSSSTYLKTLEKTPASKCKYHFFRSHVNAKLKLSSI